MEVKQALNIVKQGLDIALVSGAFKKTEDVALLHNSLLEVQKYVELKENDEAKGCEEVEKVIKKK